jgi:CubicO group peptidase (beta-lactamase class C family)
MPSRYPRLIASLLIAVSGSAQAADAPPKFEAELNELVPSLMRDFGARGIGVALIEKGKVSGTHYYGFANAEKRVPMSAATAFQPASIAKSMTAAGIVLLAQDGRIKLDDPLFSRVKGWQPPPAQFDPAGITIRRVLGHSSGLSRWTTGLWTVKDKLPTLTAALSGDNPDREPTLLAFEPGSKYSYSGSGYSLMQLLVQETTGKPFSSYIQARVLRPMGLTHSQIGWASADIPHELQTYDEFGMPLDHYRTVELGAGGWVTTLPDLAKYATTFARVNMRKGPLSPASKQMMMTPVANARVSDKTMMGLGLFIDRMPDGRKLVGHTGGNPGVGALFSIDPETGDGIAIIVNRSWANQVYNPIACAWRNATRPAASAAETCNRDPTGIILNAIATGGLAAGKEKFDALYAGAPDRLKESRVSWIAERLFFTGRGPQSLAALRWHPNFARSAELHEILGEILSASGDKAGAQAAWTETLRLEPGRPGIDQKLKDLG